MSAKWHVEDQEGGGSTAIPLVRLTPDDGDRDHGTWEGVEPAYAGTEPTVWGAVVGLEASTGLRGAALTTPGMRVKI